MKNRVLTFLMVIGMVGLLVGCSKLTKATLSDGTYVVTNEEKEEIIKTKDGQDLITFVSNKPIFEEKEELAFVKEKIDEVYNDYEIYVKDELSQIATSNKEYMSSDVNFTAKRNFKIKNNENQIMSIVLDTQEYTGGAHGNSFEISLNFDVANQKILTLQDIFNVSKEEYEKKLHELIEQRIEEIKKEGTVSFFDEYETFIDDAFDTQNFYFSEDKIVFIYGEYQISPYSEGIQNIEIFLSDLKTILKEEYKIG